MSLSACVRTGQRRAFVQFCCMPNDGEPRVTRRGAAVVIGCGVLFIALLLFTVRDAVDFDAFYCAGRVLSEHADPYRIEPLRTCEQAVNYARFGGVAVLPAPLPGYDLLAFTVLARLPYRQAEFFWRLLIWIAVVASIVVLERISAFPLPVVALALLFSDGSLGADLGNVAPFCVLGVASAAFFASRKRYTLAAAAATGAMCEPHVGLGALLTLFFFAPASRSGVLLGLSVLGVLTYAATGISGTAEYFVSVLPLHAVAEVSHHGQFSLTHVLHIFGVSDAGAVAAGEGCYVAMLIAGLIVAARLRAALQDDAVLVAVPVAFTLIGGPFVHLVQIAAALPCALILDAHLPRFRPALRWAVVLLAVPWAGMVNQSILFELFVAMGIFALAWYCIGDLRVAGVAASAQLATFGLLVSTATPGSPLSIQNVHLAPTAFSDEVWRIVVSADLSAEPFLYFAFLVPTWCGLLIVAWAAISTAFNKGPIPVTRG